MVDDCRNVNLSLYILEILYNWVKADFCYRAAGWDGLLWLCMLFAKAWDGTLVAYSSSKCLFLKKDRISFNNSWKLYLRKYLDNYMYEKNIINGFAIYVVYGWGSNMFLYRVFCWVFFKHVNARTHMYIMVRHSHTHFV